MRIELFEGDIAGLWGTDAIANAANTHLWMGSGVAGAIKRAGGEEIEAEAIAQGPIPVGTAVATSGGRLHARHVIHGAVMGQDLRTDRVLVFCTTRACLALADELGCRSLALPAFGTGVGGVPLDWCAQDMVNAVRTFEPEVLERVTFAVFGPEAYAAFARELFDGQRLDREKLDAAQLDAALAALGRAVAFGLGLPRVAAWFDRMVRLPIGRRASAAVRRLRFGRGRIRR